MRHNWLFLASLTTVLSASAGSAHHSFAAFFDAKKLVTIKGVVTQFGFTNPHGVIALMVAGADGSTQEWRIETNAPVILARRGWSRSSLKPGETITIEGWAARNGKPYLRLRQARRADGSPIGTPFGQGDN